MSPTHLVQGAYMVDQYCSCNSKQTYYFTWEFQLWCVQRECFVVKTKQILTSVNFGFKCIVVICVTEIVMSNYITKIYVLYKYIHRNMLYYCITAKVIYYCNHNTFVMRYSQQLITNRQKKPFTCVYSTAGKKKILYQLLFHAGFKSLGLKKDRHFEFLCFVAPLLHVTDMSLCWLLGGLVSCPALILALCFQTESPLSGLLFQHQVDP